MKAVFITGAGGGIGQATARLFAEKGWFVGLYDVNEASVETLHQELGKQHSCYGVCDVTSQGSIQQAVAAFAKHTNNQMHAFINNAGVLFGGEFADVPMEQHELTIDVNIKGLTYCTQAAFPLLEQTPNSHLVNLCSVSSIHGVPALSIYSSSKAYVRSLTEALHIEWRNKGINVCSVLPPLIKTNMLKGVPEQLTRKLGVNQTAEDVAQEVYRATTAPTIHRIISFKGKLANFLTGLGSAKTNRAIWSYLTGYSNK